MAPPGIPGARKGVGRPPGQGGKKGRMGKRFKQNKDGTKKEKPPRPGGGWAGLLAVAGGIFGLVAWVAHNECQQKEQRSKVLVAPKTSVQLLQLSTGFEGLLGIQTNRFFSSVLLLLGTKSICG